MINVSDIKTAWLRRTVLSLCVAVFGPILFAVYVWAILYAAVHGAWTEMRLSWPHVKASWYDLTEAWTK